MLKSTYTEARSPKPLHTRGSPRRHDSTQAGLCAHASATPGTAVERGCAAEGHSATTSQGHSSNRWLSWKNPSGKSHSQLCAGGTTGELRDSDGQERKRATRLHGQRAASPAGGAPSGPFGPPTHTAPPSGNTWRHFWLSYREVGAQDGPTQSSWLSVRLNPAPPLRLNFPKERSFLVLRELSVHHN